ncbi:MAG: helix-turn-helix transcriptional regulator, partial [Chloroflexi bacterium]|nr:helix-turn-helix transcriptional regulator [Chloroflexota bacterium]
RNARLMAGRSQAELASALRVSRHRYASYEQGRQDPTLPELELIAELCDTPLGYFFDDESTVEDEDIEKLHQALPRIQRKITGALLRQARLKAGKTQEDCAKVLGIPARRISQYEYGERDIPASELQTLALYLGVDPDYFTV